MPSPIAGMAAAQRRFRSFRSARPHQTQSAVAGRTEHYPWPNCSTSADQRRQTSSVPSTAVCTMISFEAGSTQIRWPLAPRSANWRRDPGSSQKKIAIAERSGLRAPFGACEAGLTISEGKDNFGREKRKFSRSARLHGTNEYIPSTGFSCVAPRYKVNQEFVTPQDLTLPHIPSPSVASDSTVQIRNASSVLGGSAGVNRCRSSLTTNTVSITNL